MQKEELHKTLLVCIVESLFFVLNISTLDIVDLVDQVELDSFEFYKNNFFLLNFENLVPLPLKKHFLDIETYFLSYMLWRNKEVVYTNLLESPKMSKIFERIMYYMSSQLNQVGKSLGLDASLLEKIWVFFKKIWINKREIFYSRFIEQIIMCSIYSICKVSNSKKIKFQSIISNYQNISPFSKYLFQNIIYKVKMKDKDSSNDIIHFYNDIFVVKLKSDILDSGKITSLDELNNTFDPFSKPYKHFTNTTNFEVINSPLSKLISTPFTYHNKEVLFSKAFRSPTSLMMKMNHNPKFPMKSKKVLNFDKKVFAKKKKKKKSTKNRYKPLNQENLDKLQHRLNKFRFNK